MTNVSLSGKVGLVVGVANKRSLSWAIAQAAGEQGALLALTHQGERLEENVRELSAVLADPLILPCDVSSEEQMDAVFAAIDAKHGGLDFWFTACAFADREDLARPFSETSRVGFAKALDISAYSLLALTKRAAPLMDKRGGGSVLTLSYLGSERVFTNYNVMGVAKAALECSVRYLASELGPRNIRVNAISAGPVKTLAASGFGFSGILQTYETARRSGARSKAVMSLMPRCFCLAGRPRRDRGSADGRRPFRDGRLARFEVLRLAASELLRLELFDDLLDPDRVALVCRGTPSDCGRRWSRSKCPKRPCSCRSESTRCARCGRIPRTCRPTAA